MGDRWIPGVAGRWKSFLFVCAFAFVLGFLFWVVGFDPVAAGLYGWILRFGRKVVIRSVHC